MLHFSSEQIDKIGKRFAAGKATEEDLQTLNDWRKLHWVTINTFQATLRNYVKDTDKSHGTVAQRLKRLPTILDKLNRIPTMRLSQMQDIGGLRAIVGTVDKVRKIEANYKKSRIKHTFKLKKDYITDPKDSGYRGIHLVYAYNNMKNPDCNGMLIEIQLRTRLQHLWATAVETVDFFFQQSLKNSEENNKWAEFFKLTSALFALEEKQQTHKEYHGQTEHDIIRKFHAFESQNHCLKTVETIRMTDIVKDQRLANAAYWIIESRFNGNFTTRIYPFTESQEESADLVYRQLEQSPDCKNGKSQIVLVSVDSIKKLTEAYPNFFGNISGFIIELDKIVKRNGE
jgi:ppGpp synthetase/RelA/SpoT-type nucleotidyltranferase